MRNSEDKGKPDRAWNAATLLHEMMMSRVKLAHYDAVRALRTKYGDEFIYTNRNGNPAIDEFVLSIFELRTKAGVVWSKFGHYWRHRRDGDPASAREVRI